MKNIKRSYIREMLDAIKEDTISFAGGLPNEDLFPLEQLKSASLKVLEDKSSLQYSKSQGIDSLREKIASLYTESFDFITSKDEILITTGSQQAFDIISKTFLKKDILVQTPTYIGALNSFRAMNLSVESFEDLHSLNKNLKEDSALYLMSDICNPTGKTMSKIQRDETLKVLKEKQSFLIEDGAYSLLNFDKKINKPICASYKNSFHLGSFSKIISPGLRVGWIRANKELIEQILIYKEVLDIHTSTLNQMILNEYLEDNDLFLHINKIREDYKNKMNFMSSCFEKYLPSFKFEKPAGGMFIYGEFEEDSFSLAKKALEHNIAFVPSEVFFHDNRNSKQARFNFTNSSYDNIEKGIKLLAEILRKKESVA